MEKKARIVVEKQKDGRDRVTVVDPHSGRVVSDHRTASGESDVRRIKESLERAGNRTDVVER